jgi:hypothetical protein
MCALPFQRCLHKRLPALAHYFNIDWFALFVYEAAQCLSCCQTSHFERTCAFFQFHLAGFPFRAGCVEHFRDFLFTFFLSKEDGEGALNPLFTGSTLPATQPRRANNVEAEYWAVCAV